MAAMDLGAKHAVRGGAGDQDFGQAIHHGRVSQDLPHPRTLLHNRAKVLQWSPGETGAGQCLRKNITPRPLNAAFKVTARRHHDWEAWLVLRIGVIGGRLFSMAGVHPLRTDPSSLCCYLLQSEVLEAYFRMGSRVHAVGQPHAQAETHHRVPRFEGQIDRSHVGMA
jgi:hypothetical protein